VHTYGVAQEFTKKSPRWSRIYKTHLDIF